MGRGRAQPAADDRRPHRHRQRRARRDHARLDDAAPRRRPPSSRSPRLDDTRYSVRLHGGSVAARLRNPQSLAEFELDHRRRALSRPGRRPLSLRPLRSDQRRHGHAAARRSTRRATPRLPVTTGQHAQFWIDAAGVPQYAMRRSRRATTFAGWNDERDRAEDRPSATTTRYVSPEMTGAEDLDRYGQLGADAGIRRALDAARRRRSAGRPYSTGHWAWVRPWGWTWVDDAPWGFAPFHYGRWVYHRNCLVLGARHATSRGRSMRRRWSPGSAGRAPASRCRSAAARRSAGSRSRRARSTCRPTGPARATCSRSTSPTSPTSPTSRRSSTTATARPIGATSRTASTRMR